MSETNSTDPSLSEPDVGERLDAQAEQIRAAAKWLVASFAAVGAALIAGSQLSSIGKLPVCAGMTAECARLWVAVAGAMTGMAGVMWAVWTGVKLLAPAKLQMGDLKADWKEGSPIHDYFQKNPSQLQGFDNFEDIEVKEAAAYARFDELNERLVKTDDARAKKQIEDELDEADVVLRDLLTRSDDVVTIANHVQFVHSFRQGALRHLLLASAIGGLGIIAFAWAANPPAATSASLREVDLSGADLRGADLRNVDMTDAVLKGADLTGANLSGAVLEDADLDNVTWKGTVCPDGTNSDDAAGSCVNHL